MIFLILYIICGLLWYWWVMSDKGGDFIEFFDWWHYLLLSILWPVWLILYFVNK